MFLYQNGPRGHCELKQLKHLKQLEQLNRGVADLIDLIGLIHNGARCELNQLHRFNQKCFCAKTAPGAVVN